MPAIVLMQRHDRARPARALLTMRADRLIAAATIGSPAELRHFAATARIAAGDLEQGEPLVGLSAPRVMASALRNLATIAETRAHRPAEAVALPGEAGAAE